MKKVTIIGAGIAACTAAKLLYENGFEVQILEKSRGAGGRMSTKRMTGTRADHGAQYFSAKTPNFIAQVEQWLKDDLVQAWKRDDVDKYDRYFCKSGMSSLPKSLLPSQVELLPNEKVSSWKKKENKFKIFTESGSSYSSDYLICTAPSPQTIELLKNSKSKSPALLKGITYEPCFALLLLTEKSIKLPHNAAINKPNSTFNWLMSNEFKGFAEKPTYTLHTTHEFASRHFDKSIEVIEKMLLEKLPKEFEETEILEAIVHKWRYGIAMKRISNEFLLTEQGVYLGGDGFGIGNVEGAFLSGYAIAEDLSRKV